MCTEQPKELLPELSRAEVLMRCFPDSALVVLDSMEVYKVALLRDVRPPKSNFVPHIYTDDEIDRYFKAVDAYDFPGNPKSKIQLPVLFRLLYSCLYL